MQLAAAGNLKAVGGIRLLHTQAHICIQLPEQTLPDMAGGDEFPLLAGQGTVVYHEVHGNGGLRDLLERDRHRIFRRTDGVADVDIRDTGHSHDGSDLCTLDLHPVQAVKLIQLSDLHSPSLVHVMMVYDDAVLIDPQGTVVDLSDPDPAHVLVIVDGTDEKLGISLRISLRSRDIADDRFK